MDLLGTTVLLRGVEGNFLDSLPHIRFALVERGPGDRAGGGLGGAGTCSRGGGRQSGLIRRTQVFPRGVRRKFLRFLLHPGFALVETLSSDPTCS